MWPHTHNTPWIMPPVSCYVQRSSFQECYKKPDALFGTSGAASVWHSQPHHPAQPRLVCVPWTASGCVPGNVLLIEPCKGIFLLPSRRACALPVPAELCATSCARASDTWALQDGQETRKRPFRHHLCAPSTQHTRSHPPGTPEWQCPTFVGHAHKALVHCRGALWHPLIDYG